MSRPRWKERTIGEICDFTNGSGFKPSDWGKEGLPIIRIQNLNGSRGFHYFAGMTDKRRIVEPGDLLFAWAGTRGVSFGPTLWKGERGVLNQHIYSINPHEGIDKQWLYHTLQLITSRIEAKAHGFKSTLVHVHKSEITKQVVSVPPLNEQLKIARILHTWAVGIETTENLLAAKIELRGNLLQQLITGKKRFREFLDREWLETTFDKVLNETSIPGSDGRTAKKLTVKLYGKGVIQKRDERLGSKGTRYYVRRAGQFIYSKLDFLNGAFGIVPEHLDGFESTLDLPAFEIDETVDSRWLLYYVTRQAFYGRFSQAAEGGRKARRVHPLEFLKTKIRLPELEEQHRIGDALRTCDSEVQTLKDFLDALKRQKRGLMQKLLTGQIRVNSK